MKTSTTGRKGGAGGAGSGKGKAPRSGTPIHDCSGEWSGGLRHDGQAALVGTILAAMPHLDELVADLVADRLGADASAVLAALDQNDPARMALLGSLPGLDDALAAAIDDYADVRRLWRAYGGGLWYTHQSGRTYLAAPDADGAAFRVAREVKPASLRAARERVDRLAGMLAALVDGPPGSQSRVKPPQTAKAKPPQRADSAALNNKHPPEPHAASAPSAPPPAGETPRAKRVAPTRTAGARRRKAPVRPPRDKAPDAAKPPEGGDAVPSAAE